MSADQSHRFTRPSDVRRKRSCLRRRVPLLGMTIVEMLIIIGVIGLIVAITVPAFRGVQVRNRKTLEANDIRQVFQAWNVYANFNRDAALPGYIEPEVQERWRVHYEYPIAPNPSSPQDRLIPQHIAAPWTFRLGQYFDHHLDVLWRYREAPARSWPSLVALARDGALAEIGYSDVDELMEAVAYEPAFAYNAFHIGGWWEMTDALGTSEIPRPRLFNANYPGESGSTVQAQVITTSIPSVRRPASLVVFCTASRYEVPGVQMRNDDRVAGWHVVTPPWWRQTLSSPELRFWSSPAAYLGTTSARETLIETFENLEFSNEAYAPIGRYNDRVTVVHADGSIESTYPAPLTTPMRWIDRATNDWFEFEPE